MCLRVEFLQISSLGDLSRIERESMRKQCPRLGCFIALLRARSCAAAGRRRLHHSKWSYTIVEPHGSILEASPSRVGGTLVMQALVSI